MTNLANDTQPNCRDCTSFSTTAREQVDEIVTRSANSNRSVRLHQRIKKQTDFPEATLNPFLSKSVDVTKNGTIWSLDGTVTCKHSRNASSGKKIRHELTRIFIFPFVLIRLIRGKNLFGSGLSRLGEEMRVCTDPLIQLPNALSGRNVWLPAQKSVGFAVIRDKHSLIPWSPRLKFRGHRLTL